MYTKDIGFIDLKDANWFSQISETKRQKGGTDYSTKYINTYVHDKEIKYVGRNATHPLSKLVFVLKNSKCCYSLYSSKNLRNCVGTWTKYRICPKFIKLKKLSKWWTDVVSRFCNMLACCVVSIRLSGCTRRSFLL